ncbi:Spy/CpxP family protein refolding chaperone [Alkalihalophilus sp. As8PL]|uniref:Spy/CpxP family protein refolding chaperone n=1 Tax=Alkalihalophilus sp. As8PL TaxID=3237103 RepID=A0AB39BVT9_9BACI
MNRTIIMLSLLIPFALAGCFSSTEEESSNEMEAVTSPYVELTDQEIKALPEGRIQALLDGAGAGYALSAELNSYPGPLHTLELALELSLSEEQKEKTEELYNGMKEEAQKIGEQIVNLELQLENAFRAKTITKNDVDNMTNQISNLDGKLRSVHLNAHIDMMDVLTNEQIKMYDELRGYSSDHDHTDHNHHHGHGH